MGVRLESWWRAHFVSMMMIFYLFLQKQQIDYRHIPVWVHPQEIAENTCDDVAIMFLGVS
jgi:hypothetical protein